MKEKKQAEQKHLGPLRIYPGLKRDALITVGLIILLLIIRAIGS